MINDYNTAPRGDESLPTLDQAIAACRQANSVVVGAEKVHDAARQALGAAQETASFADYTLQKVIRRAISG